MTQQLGINVIIDVDAALQTGSLEGCTYFFDNAVPFGTTGQGTDRLVSAIHGTCWLDGSQATEHVLNFLATAVTSLPVTLPRNYQYVRAIRQETDALAAIRSLAARSAKSSTDLRTVLATIPTPLYSSIRHLSGNTSEAVLFDLFGKPVQGDTRLDTSEVAQLPPIITGISGEAVENGIIYPAQYGSPDLVNGGWYWSATVATSRPKIWSYTLHILLHRLVHDAADQPPRWEPVPLTCDARLNISSQPMRNGFTGGGLGFLPIGLPY